VLIAVAAFDAGLYEAEDLIFCLAMRAKARLESGDDRALI